MELCAAVLVVTGFLSLAVPVFRFRVVKTGYPKTTPETGFSIVVAFRNEAANLPELYESICALNYPRHLIEWVVCNDHSEDDSKNWILDIQKTAPFRVIYCENTSETGKKAALYNAVRHAEFETLLFTDADCIIPPETPRVLDDSIKNNAYALIAGPIKFTGNSTLLHHYQCMESAVLMALTANAFSRKQALLANGASLCVQKSLFQQAQPERKDLTIPGGDDIFLLEYAMKKNPEACFFLNTPDNIVQTRSETSWNSLLNQRTRWAAKVKYQQNKWAKTGQFFSIIFSLLYIASILLIPFSGWTLAGIFVLGKLSADLILLARILPALSYPYHLIYIPVCSVIQVFIMLYTTVRSRFGEYYWKGRIHQINHSYSLND